MAIANLTTILFSHPDCFLRERNPASSQECGLSLPADITYFFSRVENGYIFANPRQALPEDIKHFEGRMSRGVHFADESNLTRWRNGWQLFHLPFGSTLNEEYRYMYPGCECHPHYDCCFIFGCSEDDGGIQICLDLNPPNAGRVFYMHHEFAGPSLGCAVIAQSFTEWLERTIAAGPDAPRPYWWEQGFKDYGPVIPNDPSYEPVRPDTI